MTALAGTTAILSPHTLQKQSAIFLSLIKHFTTAFEQCLPTQSVKHWAKSVTIPQGSRFRSETQKVQVWNPKLFKWKVPFKNFFGFLSECSEVQWLLWRKKTNNWNGTYTLAEETTVIWKTFLKEVWGWNLNLRESINVKQPTITPYVMHCSVSTRHCHLIALLLILPTRSRLCFEKQNAAVFFVLILVCGVWGFFFFLADFIDSHLLILSEFNDLVDKSKLEGRDCTTKCLIMNCFLM